MQGAPHRAGAFGVFGVIVSVFIDAIALERRDFRVCYPHPMPLDILFQEERRPSGRDGGTSGERNLLQLTATTGCNAMN